MEYFDIVYKGIVPHNFKLKENKDVGLNRTIHTISTMYRVLFG